MRAVLVSALLLWSTPALAIDLTSPDMCPPGLDCNHPYEGGPTHYTVQGRAGPEGEIARFRDVPPSEVCVACPEPGSEAVEEPEPLGEEKPSN